MLWYCIALCVFCSVMVRRRPRRRETFVFRNVFKQSLPRFSSDLGSFRYLESFSVRKCRYDNLEGAFLNTFYLLREVRGKGVVLYSIQVQIVSRMYKL